MLDYSSAERAKVVQYLLEYSGDMYANLHKRALEFRALAETDPTGPVAVERLEQFYRAIYAEGDAEGSGFQWFVRYVQGVLEHLTGRKDRYPGSAV